MSPLRPHQQLALCILIALGVAGCATQVPDKDAADKPVAASAPLPASTPASGPLAGVAAAEPAPAEPPVAVDPLRPEAYVDLDDEAAQGDLWARVRRGFAMPNLQGDRVRNREQWYASRPEYVQRMTERGSRYLFHIVEELERRGMPTELALLPFIESAFNPQAVSSARASGMWQFIPSTGRHFDLKQNVFRDDRRDVLASTRAALDYLSKLHVMFGDWHLALAAYNWGEGSVQRAIARNRKAGKRTDYASLRMPNETRYYVPKLQAVKNIVARPETFGLTLPELSNHPYFLSVPITRDIDVDLAAQMAGLESEEFKHLNPQMNKPVILAAGTPQILLPYESANRFVHELMAHTGPLATWTAWVVPKTLRPADAAKEVGMSEETLREVNRIPPHMLVTAGSTLLVPRNGHADVSEHIADHAKMSLAPDGPSMRRVVLKAGKRDSVATIARRYKISAGQVAQWNDVGNATRFRAGQTVVVYVKGTVRHKAAQGSSARTHTATRKTALAKTARPASAKTPVRVAKAGKSKARTGAGE